MSNILIVGGGDGIGGLVQTFQCAYFASLNLSDKVFVGLSCSDIAYQTLFSLFSDKYFIHQLPIEYSQNHKLLHDDELLKKIKFGYDEFYYVCPDLLYRNPYFFPADEFGTCLTTLRSTRLLTHKLFNSKYIYCAINSSTEGYSYSQTPKLIHLLSEAFPDYQINVPVLDSWAGVKLNSEQFKQPFQANVTIDWDPNIVQSFAILTHSEMCVCLDNGASHVSYHLGNNRVLLDPRHGWKRETLPWRVRWRQTDDDSVSINTKPEDIVNLLYLNKTTPQTQLIPKSVLVNNLYGVNWDREMMFKY